MDILILTSQIEMFDTSYHENERSFDVLVNDSENTQGAEQKGHSRQFSGPWLA